MTAVLGIGERGFLWVLVCLFRLQQMTRLSHCNTTIIVIQLSFARLTAGQSDPSINLSLFATHQYIKGLANNFLISVEVSAQYDIKVDVQLP